MTTNTKNETTIEADPNLPTIRITRDFDAPRDRVFCAWVDPELIVKWLGPEGAELRLDVWEPRTGGRYRYTAGEGADEASFYGSFHEVRKDERLVQTFTFEGVPDGVFLETMTFDDLGDGRSRVTTLSVIDTIEARDAMIASGMEAGVVDGYKKLDALLAAG